MGQFDGPDAFHQLEESYQMLFRRMLDGFALFGAIFDEAGKPASWEVTLDDAGAPDMRDGKNSKWNMTFAVLGSTTHQSLVVMLGDATSARRACQNRRVEQHQAADGGSR